MNILAEAGLVQFAPQNLGIFSQSITGNINEAAGLLLGNVNEFVKNTPYEIEFPIAPKSISCGYSHVSPPSTKAKLKSIKAKLEGTKVTIKTSDFLQQMFIYCDLRFDTEVDNQTGTVTLGSESSTFKVKIGNDPLVIDPYIKTKDDIEVSGIATAALALATSLRVHFTGYIGSVTSGECELDVEGVKSQVAMKRSGYAPSLPNFEVDISASPIAEGKKFKLKCKKKDILITVNIENYEPVTLSGYGVTAVTWLNANSASSVGVTVAIIASAASIMSLFF